MIKTSISLLFALCVAWCTQAQEAEIHLDKQTLHPRYREWAVPQGGRVVRQNPPVFLWPAGTDRQATYFLDLSTDPQFAPDKTQPLIGPLSWAEYTTHLPMKPGSYYWRVKTLSRDGRYTYSDTYHFILPDTARHFATPTGDQIVRLVQAKCHPRLYVCAEELPHFRAKNKTNTEALALLHRARRNIDKAPTPIAPTRPRDTSGMNYFQKQNMLRFMYHQFGAKAVAPIEDFSLAYLLTGEEMFAHAAVRHALHVAAMPTDSEATKEDFNRSSILLGLATAYDTAYDFLTEQERATLLAAIKVQGDHFYRHYVKNFETHSMDNHVWQHTFRRFFLAAMAVSEDLPEATQWLRYCYETWCCRFPILGGDDGGWHDGSSYFQVNFETFIYLPFMLKRLTGVDFFDLPWYHNLPSFLIYSFPKGSYSTGFGDGFEKMKTPSKMYAGFADALARELKSPEARWYADQLLGGASPTAANAASAFTLYRLLSDVPADSVQPQAPAVNCSKYYPDAGFSLMHTDPTCAEKDLMATFMALPFGATGHAHAAHNGFTISYGGRELFGGTGHYSNFNDRHTLLHYRTRGHNTILADGMAQTIGENGYGWLARFADTPALTYTLGDATHAYDSMRTPFWIDRMQLSGVEYTHENGFGDPGITRFRRHFLFLKPNIIVIYDELEAKDPVTWTWLLHGYQPIDKLSKTAVTSTNGAGFGRMDLLTTGKLSTTVSNDFFAPAINWKGRTGEGGAPLEYTKHWHTEFATAEKSRTQRFLAIFQISPEEQILQSSPKCNKKGVYMVGNWRIQAQLDGAKPASLVVTDHQGNRVLYGTSASKIAGSTVVRSQSKAPQELIDKLPLSVF
ncbi:MAG: DUF4962 domain-containing protein [Alistipes sp.]